MSIDQDSMSGLSPRGQLFSKDGAYLRDHFSSVWGNIYSPSSPSGLINLGTSDNYVMGPEIAKFINEKVHFTAQDIDYGTGSWGSPRLRKAAAKFFDKWFSPLHAINEDDILFSTGCTSLCEMLGFTIFEPGEGLLLSMPIYQAFQRDFGIRANVKPVFVRSQGINEFGLAKVALYEDALKTAESCGINIRALLLCNPHNPLGRCYEPEALIEYMKLCEKYSIHLIVDEVYALSIYGSLTDEKTVEFKSVMAIDTDQYIDKNYLHVLYGFSKDFAAGGLRLGCIWSRNTQLISALSGLTFFNWPTNLGDRIALTMFEDEEWFKDYVVKNQKCIRTCAEFAVSLLEEFSIPYIKGSYAGFFIMIDLRSFVPGKNVEQVTFEDEKDLKLKMKNANVYFTSGQGMSCEEPCFFRFCFMKNPEEVRLGIERLHDALMNKKTIEN